MKNDLNDIRKQILRPVIFLLILGMTLISGCFDSEDIDRRMIVSPIGIDSNPDGKMVVTFRMPIVSPLGHGQGSETTKKQFITRTSITHGVLPALIDFQNRDEHEIFIGQCRSVLFGESMARKGLKPALDFFDRIPTFPPSAFIIIARPRAEDLLKIDWPEQETHGQNFRWFFTNRINQIFGIKKWTFFRNIYDPLEDPAVPIVAPSDENTSMRMLGLAVFRGDRMIGELDSEETIFLGMLKNPNKNNRLVIPLTGATPTSFYVSTGKKQLKVLYRDNRPLFSIRLKLTSYLGELGDYQTPLDQRELRKIEQKCGQYVQDRVLSLLHKLKTLESDPLDMGNNFRIQQQKHFSLQRWPEDYRNAEFQVSVKFFIERLGVLR